MRNRLLSTTLLAVLAATLPAAAPAASSASATVSILSVQFFDLDTGDGITPGIVWNTVSIAKSFTEAAVSHEAAPALDLTASGSGALPFGALTRQATSTFAQAQASIAGGDGFNPLSGTVLTASGSATGNTPGAGTVGFRAQALAPDAFYAGGTQFTLSANTIAVFRASVSVSANVTAGSDADTFAEATGFLRALGTGATDATGNFLPCGCGAGAQNLVDSLSISAVAGQSFSNSGTLLVTFTNATGVGKVGFLGAEAIVLGSTIAPVPEPTQALLLLAGLAVMGVTARRRRR